MTTEYARELARQWREAMRQARESRTFGDYPRATSETKEARRLRKEIESAGYKLEDLE